MVSAFLARIITFSTLSHQTHLSFTCTLEPPWFVNLISSTNIHQLGLQGMFSIIFSFLIQFFTTFVLFLAEQKYQHFWRCNVMLFFGSSSTRRSKWGSAHLLVLNILQRISWRPLAFTCTLMTLHYFICSLHSDPVSSQHLADLKI